MNPKMPNMGTTAEICLKMLKIFGIDIWRIMDRDGIKNEYKYE
jgi:hypothetical protein